MQMALRPALQQDFGYCRRIYFAEMNWIIEELHLDLAAQEIGFQQQWDPTQVRIVVLDGADVGWLQTITQAHELFVARCLWTAHFSRRVLAQR